MLSCAVRMQYECGNVLVARLGDYAGLVGRDEDAPRVLPLEARVELVEEGHRVRHVLVHRMERRLCAHFVRSPNVNPAN